VIENFEFEEFYRSIRSEINDDSSENLDTVYRIDRFTEYFTSQLAEFGVTNDATICSIEKVFANSKAIANAWNLDGEGRLSLFITDFHDSDKPEAVGKKDIDTSLKRAQNVYRYAKKIDYKDLEQSKKEHAMIRTIQEAMSSISGIHVYYLTDGILSKTGDTATTLDDLPVYVSYWDIKRLYRLVSSGRGYEPIEINFEKKFGQQVTCLSMAGNTDEYQGFLAMIPGDILAALYEEYGSRLLELNVRAFLTHKIKVNKGIRKTILDEPSRFLAYNNGISATAEEIITERTPDGDLAIKQIKGLQIVNGGQTVASIARASKVDKCTHLNKLAVQAKISVVKAGLLEELVPKISRYSNTQNNVNEADFASNDPFHISIEQLANTVWTPGEQSRWFYERARGQYEVAKQRNGITDLKKRNFEEQTPKAQKFSKVDLAKFYNCWDQKPDIVSQGAQKSFVEFMTNIANGHPNFKPDEEFYKHLIAKAIIYKASQKIATKHKFPGYRANAVAYTLSLVAFKTVGRINLKAIWDQQDISIALRDLITDWMPIVWNTIISSAGTRNVTEWAKKADCWHEIQLLDVSIPPEMEMEMLVGDPLPTVGKVARGGRAAELSTLDRQNINRVIRQKPEFLLQLGMWGKKTGELEQIQIDIVLTVSTYAAGGWMKIPSHKQAGHVVSALEIAKEANFVGAEQQMSE
jgi:hypothetical protein